MSCIQIVDADGVALAAIQGLNQKVDERDTRIRALEEQNQALQDRLRRLEEVVTRDKHLPE